MRSLFSHMVIGGVRCSQARVNAMAFSSRAFTYYFNQIRSLTVKTRWELLILSLMFLPSSVMAQTPQAHPASHPGRNGQRLRALLVSI